MSGKGRLGLLTLDGVSSWPVIAMGVPVYAALRYVGDPPYSGADIGAYLVSIVMPGVVLAALLLIARLLSRITGIGLDGAPVALIVLGCAAVSQLPVPATGSVIAAQRVDSLAISVLTEALFMAALWCLIALTVVSVSTFRRQTRSLRTREGQLEDELVHLDAQSAREEAATVNALTGIIDGAASDLASRDLGDVSSALRDWTERIIRPMSHEFAASNAPAGASEEIRLSSQWLAAAQLVTSRDPYPAVVLGVIALVASPGVLFRSYPPIVALLSLAAIVGYTIAAAALVNLVTRPVLPRLRLRSRMLLLYVITVPLVVGELALFQLPILLGYGQDQSAQALSALWIGVLISPLLGLLTIWIRILREAGDETLELRQSRARDLAIAVASRNMQMRQRRAAWAQALHGPVQSAMIAAAIRLDRAHQAGTLDDAAVAAACQPVWDALEAAKAASTDSVTWQDGIARLHSLWDGLIDLRIEVSPNALERLDRGGPCRAASLEVLTEALSNSVRHGQAKAVSVTIGIGDDQTLLLQVVDDGQAADATSPNGLGQALFDEVSVQWSRRREGGVNALTIELPALGVEASGAAASTP